jgi:hypothetical protein
MFHPFEGNSQELTDSELESRISDLTKKYYQASRLGKPEMLTQISTFITIYRNEMSRRNREKLKTQLDGDLDQLINVD